MATVSMEKGQIVRSKAGRDSGGFFVILGVEGDFALIADGKRRPLSKPKRKRLRHLAPTRQFAAADEMGTDRRLRGLLANYNQNPLDSERGTGGNELVEK